VDSSKMPVFVPLDGTVDDFAIPGDGTALFRETEGATRFSMVGIGSDRRHFPGWYDALATSVSPT
jgi:hypothetical protein